MREGGQGRGGRLVSRQDRKAKQAGLRQSLEEKKNVNGIDSKGLTKLPVIYTDGPVISRDGALMAEGLVMESDATSLYLTTAAPDIARSGSKAFAEGAAGGLALAGTAADSVVESIRAIDKRLGWLSFGRVSGGKMRYETGSNIDMNSLSLAAGIGRGMDAGAGLLTVGGFFEYGTGSFTTHNSFEKRTDVDGDGQSKYMGGGIFAKMDFENTGPGHFHADISAHMGTMHTSYDSNDITDSDGRVAAFESDTPYYGINGTLGYELELGDRRLIDLYGQHIWTKVEGSNVDISTGNIFQFDDMNSNRLRLGATYTYKGNSFFKPYVGAACEHEYSGRCESTTTGRDVDAPSFYGDSFMGELGLRTVPTKDLPLTINLGVQGFTGQKNGVSGNVFFRYDF